MLDQGNVKMVTSVWRLVGAVGIVPLRWNAEKTQLEFCSSRRRYLVCVCEFLVYCAYELFLVARWVHARYFDPGANQTEAMSLLYTSTGTMVALSINYSMLQNYGRQSDWINRFVSYFCSFGGQMRERGRVPGCRRFMNGFIIGGSSIVLMNTIAQFKKPMARQLFSSLILDPKQIRAWHLLLCLGAQLCVWWYSWLTMFAYFLTITMYLQGALWSQRFLKIQGISGHQEPLSSKDQRFLVYGGELLTRNTLAKYGRELSLVQTDFNDLWKSSLLLVETILIFCCVMSLFGSIRIGGARAFQMGFVFLLCANALFSMWKKMAHVYESSEETRGSWKRACGDGWFRRYHFAAKADRVLIGGFFHADRSIVLTLAKLIVEITVNLLVTTRQ